MGRHRPHGRQINPAGTYIWTVGGLYTSGDTDRIDTEPASSGSWLLKVLERSGKGPPGGLVAEVPEGAPAVAGGVLIKLGIKSRSKAGHFIEFLSVRFFLRVRPQLRK